MYIFVLNILGAIVVALAAILGFSSNKKWENGWFTREGYVLAGCVLLIAVSQISVQIIQNKQTIAVQKVVNEAYSGWIKVGSFKKNDKSWTYEGVAELKEKKPEDIKEGSLLVVGAEDAYYIYVRYENPGICDPPPCWFSDKKLQKNVLSKGMLLKVIDQKTFSCDSKDQHDVWARVKPYYK